MNQQEKYDTLVEILTSLPGSYIGEHYNHKITPERASEVASLIHLHGWSMKGPTDDDALRLAGWPEEYYSGPGRSFGGVPHVQRKGSRVLVTWFTGLDI